MKLLLHTAHECVDDFRLVPVEHAAFEEPHPPEASGVVLAELPGHVLGILDALGHIRMSADGSELTEEVRNTEVLGKTLVDAGKDLVDFLLARGIEDVDVIVSGGGIVVAEPVGVVAVDAAEQVVGMDVGGQLHAVELGLCGTGTIGVDQQVAELVVAAGLPNDVDEVLLREYVPWLREPENRA